VLLDLRDLLARVAVLDKLAWQVQTDQQEQPEQMEHLAKKEIKDRSELLDKLAVQVRREIKAWLELVVVRV